MSNRVHPYCTGSYSANGQRMPDVPGMTIGQYYLGCILTGLASNPATMLNIEEHLDYAIRLAKEADSRATYAGV